MRRAGECGARKYNKSRTVSCKRCKTKNELFCFHIYRRVCVGGGEGSYDRGAVGS